MIVLAIIPILGLLAGIVGIGVFFYGFWVHALAYVLGGIAIAAIGFGGAIWFVSVLAAQDFH